MKHRKFVSTQFVQNFLSLDRRIFIVTLLFVIFGISAIADASSPYAIRQFDDPLFFAKQQVVWAGIGFVSLFICANIPYRFWERIAPFVFGVAIGFLILVLLPGFGKELLGARRWIHIGPISIQPAEIVKLGVAMYMAKVASKGLPFKSYLIPLGAVGFLIMLQPDLGTAMVVMSIGFIQFFLAGISIGNILATLGGGFVLVVLLILGSDYRRERLMTFLSETSDPLGSGYHVRQILLAIGSGGILGQGIGQSRQKFLFLPETANDSIFAVMAEELGLIGGGIIIAGYIWFILLGLKIAKSAPDTFSRILAVGIVSWIGMQAFYNIGAMVSLVPLTGIPLPFISYGGSALVMMLSGVGILMSIARGDNFQVRKRK